VSFELRFVSVTELGTETNRKLEGHPGGRKLEGLWRATEWCSPRRKSWVIGSRPRRPGDRAPHPRRSVRRAARSERRISQAPTIARTGESVRRGTKAHESWPTWQQEGRPQTRTSRRAGSPGRLARVSRAGVYPATGDEGALREGCVRRPASQGVESGRRFQETASSRSSGLAPSPRERAVKGREARGAAHRGHGQDARSACP